MYFLSIIIKINPNWLKEAWRYHWNEYALQANKDCQRKDANHLKEPQIKDVSRFEINEYRGLNWATGRRAPHVTLSSATSLCVLSLRPQAMTLRNSSRPIGTVYFSWSLICWGWQCIMPQIHLWRAMESIEHLCVCVCVEYNCMHHIFFNPIPNVHSK